MFDKIFNECEVGRSSALGEKAKSMDLIKEADLLDSPIAKNIDVNNSIEKEGNEENGATLESVSSWIKDINPEYDPYNIESPYNVNCGACALSVYQRLNGNAEMRACEENIDTNDLMENVLGKKFESSTPEEIEDYLLESGDGAHSVIGVDRSIGSGHWFNAACLDGQVVAIDGQSGEILEWPPDYGDVVNWEIAK